jgi:AcrR family transcriptional regulator
MEISHQPAPLRARRGRPPSLTEAQIAEAALRLTNLVRFDELTMRGLAAELGVPVMTVYGYVPNKRALFDLITDHVLRPIDIPAADTGSWEERMRALQRETRAAVGQHMGLRSGTAIGQSAEAARLAAGVMSILADGGFDDAQAELAFATLFTFMLGQIELDALMSSLPSTDETATITASVDRDETFEFAFDVIIQGLNARLKPGGPAR